MKKAIPAILVIVTTFIVGLMNTVFLRPEDAGSWKNYVGYLFLLIAVVNSVILFEKTYKKKEK